MQLPIELVFSRTSNVFLNTGIVALHEYLRDAKTQFPDLEFFLTENELIIKSLRLKEVLEGVYYSMGKEVYEHSTEEGNLKYYFTREPFTQTAFKTKNSYGLSGLITKPPLGPQPTPRKEENAAYIGNLYENEPEFAGKIARFYLQKGLILKGFEIIEQGVNVILSPNKSQTKGDSRIFLNEEYTKTPFISFDEKFFLEGDKICSLTGEGYQKLCEVKNTSPFLKDLQNFNSFLIPDSAASISWKAMFVSRFSPKFCFYRYNSLDTIYCYLFDTDNLLNLRTLLEENRTIFMDKVQLLEANYLTNLKFYNFSSKKGDEQRTSPNNGYTEPHENRFMLIYSVYRNFLLSKSLESASELNMDIFDAAFGSKHIPVSLVAFKADKFSGTLRPNYFEQFNNFKFTVRLIAQLEQKGINFQSLLRTLLFKNRSDRNSKNSFRLERQLRNQVLNKMMKAKSILPDLETLFFKCFLYLTSPDAEDRNEAAKKNFKVLFDLVNLYEPILYRKMEQETLKTLQTRAVNLGYAIGNAILEYSDGTPQANAKQARRYLIQLHKSRNAADFREGLIRIMKKYMNGIANDLLYAEELNNDQQFVFIKQFAVMAALNKINPVLKTSQS